MKSLCAPYRSSASEASHSAPIQPSVLSTRRATASRGSAQPRRRKNSSASAAEKRSSAASISSSWPLVRSRPSPRAGSAREPMTSRPCTGNCSISWRTRPSTASLCSTSKSSMNSANDRPSPASDCSARDSSPGPSASRSAMPPRPRTAAPRHCRKRETSLSAASSVSQAVACPSACRRSRIWRMAVVLPKPAGARTSTTRARSASGQRAATARRATWAAAARGGLSLAWGT